MGRCSGRSRTPPPAVAGSSSTATLSTRGSGIPSSNSWTRRSGAGRAPSTWTGKGARGGASGNPFYERLRNTVVELLDEAVGGGEIPIDLDVECLADTLLAALNIDLYLYQRHQLGMERDRIVDGLRSLLNGLRSGG